MHDGGHELLDRLAFSQGRSLFLQDQPDSTTISDTDAALSPRTAAGLARLRIGIRLPLRNRTGKGQTVPAAEPSAKALPVPPAPASGHQSVPDFSPASPQLFDQSCSSIFQTDLV